MADFTAAFEIDDSTILFRLHEAASALAKKAWHGRGDIKISNTGASNGAPNKSFIAKDFKYKLFAKTELNLQVFDGAASFLSDNKFMEEAKLKKEIGDAAWNKVDSGHVSTLKKLKKDIFEVVKAYFKTFAGEEKANKISEDDLILVIDETKLPFDNKGKALDEDTMVGFVLPFTVGMTTGD